MQQNELPSEVILEVPSGSEFDQSRPDLPPVALYQLEPVIMPLNKNVLVLETDLDNKLTDQIFWYKALPRANFKLGAKEFWDISKDLNSDDEDETYDPNKSRKASGPRINVKKSSGW